MSRVELVYRRILSLIDILGPYVRIMRILVTFIAPIVLMVMYVIHKSYRTKQIQKMIRNFKSDKAFIYPYGSALASMIGGTEYARQQTNGIMELTQLNDMFWIRLTQVIATVIGY